MVLLELFGYPVPDNNIFLRKEDDSEQQCKEKFNAYYKEIAGKFMERLYEHFDIISPSASAIEIYSKIQSNILALINIDIQDRTTALGKVLKGFEEVQQTLESLEHSQETADVQPCAAESRVVLDLC
jgi:hypothetical protein